MRSLFLTLLSFTCINASSFSPLVQDLPKDTNKVALGKALYFDSLLSSDKSVSCASCHQFDKGGADGRTVAIGIKGRKGKVNTPTIFNTSLKTTQGWTSSDTRISQRSRAAFLNPVEMNGNIQNTLTYLKKTPSYVKMFAKSYPEITEEALFDAIEAYVFTLLTPSSFDAYLLGDKGAISTQAKKGMQLFKDKGCISCHNGKSIGGNMFQRFGVFDDETLERGDNLGRYEVTKKEEDRYVFQVPSLRNVARTAPYLHDGSIQTLREVIQLMAKHQLGDELKEEELDDLESFLRSLSGSLKDEQ